MKINTFLIYIVFLGGLGCSDSSTTITNYKSAEIVKNEQDVISEVPDPSVKKCIADGYKVIPVTEEGFVRSYACLNQTSGKPHQ